jgi:GDP-L-fucose synthase
MKKNERIYIAGHTGLVGSAIWNNLLEKGYTNLIGRTIDELDLTDQAAVRNFFREEKPDYIFLAAAKVGGIMANNTYRGEFIYQNLMIQNNVIHQAYLNGVKKLLFLGSTCIYPKEAPQPLKEEYLLTGPLEYTNEPYAVAKIAGIKLCESYNIQYGTNFIPVMPTNLYGPNDNFDLEKSHVLPALLRKILLGKWLEEDNWQAVRNDLSKRPVEGVTGQATEEEIVIILNKYGIFDSTSLLATGYSSDNSSNESRATSYEPPAFAEASAGRRATGIEIWGTGAPLREFLWSEEMAGACVYIMETVNYKDLLPPNGGIEGGKANSMTSVGIEGGKANSMTSVGIEGGIREGAFLNIGTGEEISIRDLAYLIREIAGFQGELVFDPAKPDGTMRKVTDPSRLWNLGWHHKTDIRSGIGKLLKWYPEH